MLTLLLSAAAWACGPDFPDSLLTDRGRVLLELPTARFLDEAAHLVPAPAFALPVEETPQEELERSGLSDEQWAAVQAVRAARTLAAAEAAGRGLPEDVRLYTVGAWAWNHGDADRAVAAWRAVLALPAYDYPGPDRSRRGMWAAYMLAVADGSDAAFDRVRDESRNTWDRGGFAVSSYGEQARRAWRDGDAGKAVRLYAAQAAQGSPSGALSLLFLARLVATDPRWPELARDPDVHRLLTLWAWTRPFEAQERSFPVAALLDAPVPAGAGGERLAALAYSAGRAELAARWLDGAPPTPLAEWTRAKLALRDGRTDDAAAHYRNALVRMPPDSDPSDPTGLTWCRLEGERGGLALMRGEYVRALEILLDAAQGDQSWAPTGWLDAAYVAERVLTVDELRDFVDTDPRPNPRVVGRLRALLARRLVREGRAADAVAYFDDPALADRARAYADALSRARRLDAVERAQGNLDAAALARAGIRLMGTEWAPDWLLYDGDFEQWWGEGPPPEDPTYVTANEQARVDRSAPNPNVRFHYRQVAADLAVAAARDLPTTSQAYGVALCRAAAYADRDPARVTELYRLYIETGPLYDGSGSFGSSCPEPDWAGARRRAALEGSGCTGPEMATAGVLLVPVLARAWRTRNRARRRA